MYPSEYDSKVFNIFFNFRGSFIVMTLSFVTWSRRQVIKGSPQNYTSKIEYIF